MKQYVVDAFTDEVFSGNPAAVCITKEWLSDDLMMNITRENNLSETAFVIMNYYDTHLEEVAFDTLSGVLTVKKKQDLYEMDFPAYELKPKEVTSAMEDAIGARPVEAYMGRDLLCIFESEDVVRGLSPDMEKLKTLDGLLLQVTAKGREYDCVSRSFAPKLNVPEDPVCGSG